MKERPILFSAPTVRAILEGRKTQTRRAAPIADLNIKANSNDLVTWGVSFTKPIKGSLGSYSGGKFTEDQAKRIIASQFCQYGQPGDLLWVREKWQYADWTEDGYPWVRYDADNETILRESIPENWSERLNDLWEHLSSAENYNIDNRAADRRWRSSRFMPRWASRITLEITGVRVERLQDITRGDCMDEGCPFPNMAKTTDPRGWFSDLWQTINGPGSWEINPWVWVIEFRRVEPH